MITTTRLASKDKLNRMIWLTKDTTKERDKMTTISTYNLTINLQEMKLYQQHAFVGCLT